MLNLPHELYTAEQTRELDRIVTEKHNISSAKLMARAGAAALERIKNHWPQAERILVVCGTGNNGGDGFELARQALAKDYRVVVYEVGSAGKMSEETAAAREAVVATGTEIHQFEDKLPSTDVLVDALLGTGLSREVTGIYARAIDAINKSTRIPVLSLDIPSGIHADTGRALGIAVRATITLSFLGLNKGLFTGEGPNYCGTVCFDALKVPSAIYKEFTPIARRVSLENDAAAGLAPRERTGHKGLYGHLLIIGGDHGMPGAARVAAEAGARVGAGLTSIATRSAHGPTLNLARPELMCYGVEHPDDLDPLVRPANALTVGPGLGQTSWGKSLFQKAIETNLPMVVDADALNLLSKNPQRHDNWILTPHPGEAARLLGCTSDDIQADRFAAVQKLHDRYGGIIVLKGSGTLIYGGEAPTRLSTWGNPGMGSGGMGDALAGVIGGLLAQHFTLMDAACVGVTLHGMAADKAAEQDGERGMLAMDLMPHLRHLANLKY
ncbi:NAD(P)H-hydrate dehydratase [Methylophaga sp. OBS4]|uniref:NAD(P)H-hydrate dehydratase n=1 Tax=Methylophaga sp. OBS4 TaxID=2991935 RepID=UPI002257997D|nr:NAD(P)H-hydrate dehydratase [Methylophaga sp. OBS4]MCX4187346.1 NAD(P)H-hydrate dehydratase [Methylophaga sp. OBS4]